ncbi:MAG: enoyl-CoA hydratase/isomerase family protein [Pseudomonadota bacterium]
MEKALVPLEIDGPLGILTMQYEPHNLIGPDLIGAISDGLDQAQFSGCRAILLRSGLRHFSGGADTTLFSRTDEANQDGQENSATDFLEKLETFPLPIVAAIHGVCVGGGFELALACDILIAAKSARIGSVEATLGLSPLMGAIQRQVQRVGILRAKEICMLGRRYDPETLEKWNLLNRVVADDRLSDVSHALAMELANGPTRAHAVTKQIANLAANEGVRAADLKMADLQKPIWASDDLKIGMASLQRNGPGLAKFTGK